MASERAIFFVREILIIVELFMITSSALKDCT